MLQVPVPSVQIIRAIVREYHPATHTAEVEPVLGPASLVGEIPVLMSCRPDLLTTGREVAVLTWPDVDGLVLGPYGAVPDDPPNAGDADTVDGEHAAAFEDAGTVATHATDVDAHHVEPTAAPAANKPLMMNASAKFPAHTVEGVLTVGSAAGHYLKIGTNALAGEMLAIADDAVWSVTLDTYFGALLFVPSNPDLTAQHALVMFRATTAPFCLKALAGATINVTTGVLTGTTGADGKVTISVHTDHKLYIENRSGVNPIYPFLVFFST